MKTGTKWVIGIVLITIFGTAGYIYLKNQIDLIMDFCYKPINFKIKSFVKKNISIEFFLKIRNQSKQTIIIKGYTFDILLNTYNIGTVHNEIPQTWAADNVSVLSFNISADLSKIKMPLIEILNLLNDYLIDKEKILLTIKGKLSVQLFGFLPIKNYPLERTYTLKDLLADDTNPTTCQI